MSDPFSGEIIRSIVTRPGPPGTSADAVRLTNIEARLTALEGIVNPPEKAIVAGRYYGPVDSLVGWSVLSSFGVGTDILNAGAFVWPADATVASVRIPIVTVGTATVMRLGVYTFGLNGLPTDLVLPLGDVDVTATGDRISPAVNVVLPRGTYWLAGAANGGVTIQALNTFNLPGVTSFLGHSNTSGQTAYSAVTRAPALASGFTALPTPFGIAAINAVVPAFWLVAG